MPLCSLHITRKFPFLFGGTFIEAIKTELTAVMGNDFPSFSEGLSLRLLEVQS